ncbi:MAG: DUF7455 domain-containing protein [Candidatus Nanopelagicaceae bacterium]
MVQLDQTQEQVLEKVRGWVQCDSCPARAYVKAVLPSGELWFCHHHYNKHSQALTEQGAIAKLLSIDV